MRIFKDIEERSRTESSDVLLICPHSRYTNGPLKPFYVEHVSNASELLALIKADEKRIKVASLPEGQSALLTALGGEPEELFGCTPVVLTGLDETEDDGEFDRMTWSLLKTTSSAVLDEMASPILNDKSKYADEMKVFRRKDGTTRAAPEADIISIDDTSDDEGQ